MRFLPKMVGIHMIAKAEVLQKLKKMGMVVADDASIVTVLLPKEISFEAGLKDVKKKLAELGYEASFCVKQSKETVASQANSDMDKEPESDAEDFLDDDMAEEQLTEEDLKSYLVVDPDDRFSLDDDGQFTLGLDI